MKEKIGGKNELLKWEILEYEEEETFFLVGEISLPMEPTEEQVFNKLCHIPLIERNMARYQIDIYDGVIMVYEKETMIPLYLIQRIE